mgnify:CR=1 FL=1
MCAALSLAWSFPGAGAWAVDLGWMQPGVRLWYFGSVGSTGSSDAEEAYLIKSVDNTSVQVNHHSGVKHWSTPTADTSTHPIAQGPCWINPSVLKGIAAGSAWMGIEIKSVYRNTYNSYAAFKDSNDEFDSIPYLLLPIKALFDLGRPREVVKLVYGNPLAPDFDAVWGTTFFDGETGICLYNLRLTGNHYYPTTLFLILSEINYDFKARTAFAEDYGPHTGFHSNIIKTSILPFNSVQIQSLVESRYGGTVQMWSLTDVGGMVGTSFRREHYCFFGGEPVLRRVNMTTPPTANYPPENWNEYGDYLWWWFPLEDLRSTAVQVFDVSMTRTSTAPYTFRASGVGAGLYFSELVFDGDGYMTSFCAKDATPSVNLDLCAGTVIDNTIKVEGLDYYRNTMKRAIPPGPVRQQPHIESILTPLLLD